MQRSRGLFALIATLRACAWRSTDAEDRFRDGLPGLEVGANAGTLDITAVNADTVVGDIAYSYTDLDGRVFELNGSFEVIRCP